MCPRLVHAPFLQHNNLLCRNDRLQSVVSAQQIVVLKEGRVDQTGTHPVLSVTPGTYKRMWDACTDAARWEMTNQTALAGN